jgi:hypothetical protein
MFRWKVVRLVLALVAIFVLVFHAAGYYPFISDDSLISLRYTDRLLEGKGLTWNNGERVEGYSNLLWVLATAVPGFFGVDLVDGTRLIGLAGMSATIFSIGYAYRLNCFAEAVCLLAAMLIISVSGSIAVWTIGGLEQPLVAALLAWALVLC